MHVTHLYCQATMVSAPPVTIAELLKVKVVWGIHILETDIQEYLTGRFLRYRISKAAHCSLGMVDDACVVGILLFNVVGAVDIPKILPLWYCLIRPDDSTFRKDVVAGEWEMHSAMADPE
jgi:hypothetical protein